MGPGSLPNSEIPYPKSKAADREENLAALRAELGSGRYRPGRYNRFDVLDPKPRRIAAPAYRDRIVQQALVSVLAPRWERHFVFQNFACREGKGLHRAVFDFGFGIADFGNNV